MLRKDSLDTIGGINRSVKVTGGCLVFAFFGFLMGIIFLLDILAHWAMS